MSKNPEIITGFKYAEISDIVFCGVFLGSQINELNLKENVEDYISEKEYVFIRKKQFTLKENDIIFCKTEFIKELFSILRKVDNFKNIKLITHQSDIAINKRLYSMKPDCISTWYSINVKFNAPDLVPIPIGIANFHSKNLNENSFGSISKTENYFVRKNKLLYLNFNINTNFQHRKSLFEQFRNFNWVNYDLTPISFENYLINLKNHQFVLAPWGNGIDTHRFWEILYSGSIPITKDHNLYRSFNTIPKLLIDNYKSVTEKHLINKFEEILDNKDKFTLKELDFNYWKKIITKKNFKEDELVQSIELKNKKYLYYKYYVAVIHYIKSKLKIINRLRRFFYKKFKI